MQPPVSRRISALQAGLRPLLDFLNHSEHAKRSRDPGIADFVFGNPHEMPLEGLVEAIARHVVPRNKDWFAYTVAIPQATGAIAASLRARNELPFDADDVFLAPGTFGALATAIRMAVDPEDEIIFLSPPWFFYESMIAVCGATPVRVTLAPPAFRLDANAIEAAITPRTRAVIVNSPHNPTGRIFSAAELAGLAAVLTRASARHGRAILLFSDESYNRILFDGREFVSPATAYPHTLVLYTYGKQLLAPGERIGYLAVSPAMDAREDVRAAVRFSQIVGGWQIPNATLQRAVPDLEALSIDLPALERRRDRMARALTELGYELTVPESTFYMMVRSPLADDGAFTDLLARHGVFVGPGHIFELPGYFRISLTANDGMVDRSIAGFAAAFAEARSATAR
jgi:aspartate aminotransferase